MKAPLYRQFASSLIALSNCIASKNAEWQAKHESNLETLAREFMPSGSGIDSGTKLDLTASLRNPAKLYFTTSFHHMNDGGMYDGWTEHKVTVSASLHNEFDLSISGRDRNEIKDYLHEVFNAALSEEIEQTKEGHYVSPARVEAARKFQEGVRNATII